MNKTKTSKNELDEAVDKLYSLAIATNDLRFKHLGDLYTFIESVFNETEMEGIVAMNQAVFLHRDAGIVEAMMTPLYMKVVIDNISKWNDIRLLKVRKDQTSYHEASKEIVNLFTTYSEKKTIRLAYTQNGQLDTRTLSENMISCIRNEDQELDIRERSILDLAKTRLDNFFTELKGLESFFKVLLEERVSDNKAAKELFDEFIRAMQLLMNRNHLP